MSDNYSNADADTVEGEILLGAFGIHTGGGLVLFKAASLD